MNLRNTHQKKFWTHEIPTGKDLGPIKYPRENILDPRDIHEKKFWTQEVPTKARWHNGTRPTKPTMVRDP